MIKRSTLELTKDWHHVTAGTFELATAYCCIEEGQLEVTWRDGSTSTESFNEGEGGGLRNTLSVTVVSGKFSFEQ